MRLSSAKINQTKITIEPENLLPLSRETKNETNVTTTGNHKPKIRTFTRDDVKAPIKTDIYTAPKYRPVYLRKKPETETSANSEEPKYLSFIVEDHLYYLQINPNPDPCQVQNQSYLIYDENLAIAGTLKEDTLTLLTDSEDLSQMKVIKLKTIATTNVPQTRLFGSYILKS